MIFFTRHEPSQEQVQLAHDLLGERLIPVSVPLPDTFSGVRDLLTGMSIPERQAVAMVAPTHLVEFVRMTGRPVVLFSSGERGVRVVDTAEVRMHVLPGLQPRPTGSTLVMPPGMPLPEGY